MGIYGMAVIATITATFLGGWIAFRLANPEHKSAAVLVFLVALPLQPLAFYLVRIPLLGWLRDLLVPGFATIAVALLMAPVTEEPAKWLVLLSDRFRRAITSGSTMGMAMAAGLGFGVGEIWFVAEQAARLPEVQSAPFYQFWGFLIERVSACLLHGLFLVPLFYTIATGGNVVMGGLLGMGAHLLLNAPIPAMQADLFSLGQARWLALLMFWPPAAVAGGLYLVHRLSGGKLFRTRRAQYGREATP